MQTAPSVDRNTILPQSLTCRYNVDRELRNVLQMSSISRVFAARSFLAGAILGSLGALRDYQPPASVLLVHFPYRAAVCRTAHSAVRRGKLNRPAIYRSLSGQSPSAFNSLARRRMPSLCCSVSFGPDGTDGASVDLAVMAHGDRPDSGRFQRFLACDSACSASIQARRRFVLVFFLLRTREAGRSRRDVYFRLETSG